MWFPKGYWEKGALKLGSQVGFQEMGTALTEKGTALAEAQVLNTKRSPRVSRTDGNKNKAEEYVKCHLGVKLQNQHIMDSN